MNNQDSNQGKDDGETCASCGKAAGATTRLLRCSACKEVKYCSVACQKADWKDIHRDVCRILQTRKRALDGVDISSVRPGDPFWKCFLDQATPENVKKLWHDEIGSWRVKLDDTGNLVVMDDIEEVVVGHGPCPDTSEGILKAIYACMILPENDNRPRRPDSITLEMNLAEHHKYLWSEMLRVPIPIWRDNDEDRGEARSCDTFPIRRWGKYAKGETFYEPQLKLRIEWLDDDERRECFANQNWGMDEQEFAQSVMEFPDMEEKKPRWMCEEYECWEDCLEDLEACGENAESHREHMKEELFVWQHERGAAYHTVEELCLDQYGSKTMEECVWDYCGVPRLVTEDEDADKILDSAGWECQGYKPGRRFVMTEESVTLGKRLICFSGYFWEEKKPPKESMEDMYQSYLNTLQG